MEHRYSLRFETGERAGEVIPIAGQGFTIGRRPGNALQILDHSVSGQHAEMVVDESGVVLRDLGSTNGTKVRGERVVETRLVDGDRVQFGSVDLVFVGGVATSGAAAPAAPAAAGFGRVTAPVARPAPDAPGSITSTSIAPPPTDTLLRVSPEVLARSKKRSVAGLAGLLVLVGAAAGLWFFFSRSERQAEGAAAPARASADNLLGEDGSFESDADGWKSAEGAPAAFAKAAQGRVSGAVGLVADLSEGAYALHRSREARAEPGRALVATAKVRVEAGTIAQLGLELSPPEGPDAAGAVVAWSKPIDAVGAFVPCEVATVVPPGYETARVLVLARRSPHGTKFGTVAADDASLSNQDPASVHGAVAALLGDAELALLGETAAAGVLTRGGRPVVTEIAFRSGASPAELAQGGRIAATAAAGRITLASAASGAFTLRAEARLVRAGVATTGPSGYASHGPDFEAENVTSLLLGKGADLVRVAFAAPVALKSVSEGGAARIDARSAAESDVGEVAFQLDFAEDRKKAGDLAYAARAAEKKGDLGECLKQWAELLSAYPFDEALVAEGDAKRASLVQQGLSELLVVRGEIDRARFFRLVDLYRRCRERALAVGARFQGSEVDAEARKVAAAVDDDYVGLEADLAKAERARLEAILASLEARKAEGLAAEVRAHLERMPKREAKPSTPESRDTGR